MTTSSIDVRDLRFDLQRVPRDWHPGGAAITAVRRLRNDTDALTVFFGFCLVGFFVCLPVALPGWTPLSPHAAALCRDGRIAHASASSAAAICLKSSSRSSGSALSCRPGMPWFSHQSPAST